MGFTKGGESGSGSSTGGYGGSPSFGSRLGDFVKSELPVASSLGSAVFGGSSPTPTASTPAMSLPQGNEGQPDYASSNMEAGMAAGKPGGGGGLEAILKLIMGGG